MIPALIGAAVVAAGVAYALSDDDKKSDNTTVREIPESELPPDIRKNLNATQRSDEQIPAWAKRN